MGALPQRQRLQRPGKRHRGVPRGIGQSDSQTRVALVGSDVRLAHEDVGLKLAVVDEPRARKRRVTPAHRRVQVCAVLRQPTGELRMPGSDVSQAPEVGPVRIVKERFDDAEMVRYETAQAHRPEPVIERRPLPQRREQQRIQLMPGGVDTGRNRRPVRQHQTTGRPSRARRRRLVEA